MASLNVVLTYIKGHFVDHLPFLFEAKTTEAMSQNYRVGETSGDVCKFLYLNQIVRKGFTENINAFDSKIKFKTSQGIYLSIRCLSGIASRGLKWLTRAESSF